MVSPLSDVCAIIKLSRYSGVVIRLVLVTLGLWWDLDRVSSQEYWDCGVGYLQLYWSWVTFLPLPPSPQGSGGEFQRVGGQILFPWTLHLQLGRRICSMSSTNHPSPFLWFVCINLLGPNPGIDEFSGEGDRGVHHGQNSAKVLLQYDEFEFHLKIVHDNVLLQRRY